MAMYETTKAAVFDGGKQARLLILTVQASLFGLREEWVWNQQLTI